MKCGKQPRPQQPSKHNTKQHNADAANKQQKSRFSALSPHISIIQQLKAKSPFPAGHGDKKNIIFFTKKISNFKKLVVFLQLSSTL